MLPDLADSPGGIHIDYVATQLVCAVCDAVLVRGRTWGSTPSGRPMSVLGPHMCEFDPSHSNVV